MITVNGNMYIWYLISCPSGVPSGDVYICSAYTHLEKAEKAIVALYASHSADYGDGKSDIDSPFEAGMCDELEIWIERTLVQ